MFFKICCFCNKNEKWKTLGAQMTPHMDEKSSLGRFVVILGGLLRSPSFWWYWDRQKSAPQIRKWVPRSSKRQSFRRPRGMRGASGGPYWVQELEELEEFGMRFENGIWALTFVIWHAVFPHKGGGRFNRLRAFRRAGQGFRNMVCGFGGCGTWACRFRDALVGFGLLVVCCGWCDVGDGLSSRFVKMGFLIRQNRTKIHIKLSQNPWESGLGVSWVHFGSLVALRSVWGRFWPERQVICFDPLGGKGAPKEAFSEILKIENCTEIDQWRQNRHQDHLETVPRSD